MNIYQDWRTLQWIKEVLLDDGNWYRTGAYPTYPDAGLAPMVLTQLVRIDGPTR